ncbi:biotin/lipoyl-containing protein [Proteiniborus sp. MB09-C3]|nr:biotin/lipoyl-containing protein [Proteiniborus sp. MB09-C3]WIV13357.1 biotin/lipoyl-containing protein [Proteiniborus sp. MB09-C3]
MNEIECEITGEVVEIFVGNEDIVEYGQPLMKIRRQE